PSWLRQRVPQVLGYAIVVLGAILVAKLIIAGYSNYFAWIVCFPPAMILLVLWFFDPTVMGLHAFYRDRIARAYLGEPTRQVDPQQTDDFDLGEIPPGKPIHLVCVAVNGLADDPLGSLGRCARSAVLSRHGISVGNCWRKPKGAITLGS